MEIQRNILFVIILVLVIRLAILILCLLKSLWLCVSSTGWSTICFLLLILQLLI